MTEPKINIACKCLFGLVLSRKCRSHADLLEIAEIESLPLRPLETLLALWMEAKIRGQDFDCYYAPEAHISGAVHVTHAPAPNGDWTS